MGDLVRFRPPSRAASTHERSATPAERAEPIEALGLAVATVAALRAAGVVTLGDLVSRRPADLPAIPGSGTLLLDEVRVALRLRRLAFDVRPRVATVRADPTASLAALYLEGYLPLRALTVLEGAGITTVAALCERGADDLLALPHFGRGTLAYVRYGLRRFGCALRGER